MDPAGLPRSTKAITKNPLGIIALFIFLIYSIASLVLGVSASALTEGQRWAFILFLVLFPLLILGSFVWLVANHAVKLYSPSDFRDDRSYVELNHKLEVVEIRQQAAEIDPRGNIQDAMRVTRALSSMGQIDTARSLAKAFLKVGRYADSLQLCDEIGRHLTQTGKSPAKILAYRAYCLMGLGRYSEAVVSLEQLQAESPADFDFSPRMALSYCFFKQGNSAASTELLRLAARDPSASGYVQEVERRYPEISAIFQQSIGVSA